MMNSVSCDSYHSVIGVSPLLVDASRASSADHFEYRFLPLLTYDLYRDVFASGHFSIEHSVRAARIIDTLERSYPDQPERDSILRAILRGLTGWGELRTHRVSKEAVFMGWLEYSHWAFRTGALDVAGYVAARIGEDAEGSDDYHIAAQARHFDGFVSLRLADADTAEILAERAEQLAANARERFWVYRARLLKASINIHRGNLQRARRIVASVISKARVDAEEIVPRAMLMMGTIFSFSDNHPTCSVVDRASASLRDGS